LNSAASLFSESQSRFVVTVKPENREAFAAAVQDAKEVGTVTNDGVFTVKNQEGQQWIHAAVNELERAWKGAIPGVLKAEAETKKGASVGVGDTKKPRKSPITDCIAFSTEDKKVRELLQQTVKT
ncbi:hypothetical protein P7M02_24245, partial [Vibrio parahaemolyticus]|nr:hypothetical protein [Vibrio parahaemolyticus]